MDPKKYFAFISYSHKDLELAKWLQHEFEYYELPATLRKGRDLPDSFRPIFRDEDELAGGELKPQISEALANSNYLIVVCSPNSAKSQYVDNEIKEFMNLSSDNRRRIFPFIIKGQPHQDDENKGEECFPRSLLELSEDKTDPIELIAGDMHATGRDHAFVKILAGTLKEKDISFTDLWDRYALEKAEEERKMLEQRDNLLRVQSRFLAEKAMKLIDDGDSYTARLLALEILPKNIENPNRPYVVEAEAALRRSNANRTAILRTSCNIRKVIIHPINDFILSFSQAGDIFLWNIASGEPKLKFEGLSFSFSSASLNPKGDKVLTSGADGAMRVWNIETGQCTKVITGHLRQTINVQGQDIMDYYSIYSAAWSPQRDEILSISMVNSAFKVALWNVVTGKCIKMLSDPLLGPFAFFDHHGNYFVTANIKDKIISIWDAKNLKCTKKMQGHRGQITSAKFSPDENYIVSTSTDKTIRIWDVSTGKVIRIFLGHSGFVNDASFSNDGKWIVSASDDKTVKIWDVESGECIRTLIGHEAAVNSISISSDDQLIISASEDKSIRLWEFNTRRKNKHLNDSIMKAEFIAASPLMNLIAYPIEPNVIGLWNIKSQSLQGELRGHTDMVCSVGFCPQNKLIITTSKDRTIRFWNAINLKCLKVLNKFDGQTEIITINKEESLLMVTEFVGNNIVNLFLFDMKSHEHIQTIPIPDSSVIAISDDNEMIAIGNYLGNDGNTVSILDREGKCLKRLAKHKSFINTINFSPNGQFLITSSNDTITKLWNIQTGECLLTMFGLKPTFLDNHTLCLSTPQNSLICLDINTGCSIFETNKCEYPIVNYSLGEERRKISIIYKNGEIRHWSFPPLQELIDETRERFKNRQLTPKERRKYYLE